MKKGIVVTGIGALTSIGDNVKAFSESLRKGYCGINHLHCEENPSQVDVCAEIEWDGATSLKACLKRYSALGDITQAAIKSVRRASYPMQWATVALLEAWNQAALEEHVSKDRVGIIVSGSNLNQHTQYELSKTFFTNPEFISPRYALEFMDTDYVGTLSEILGIHGEGFTVGGASASGNVGIIKAMQQIELGLTDVCVLVGGPTYLSPMELQAFVNIGAMDGRTYENVEDACRPFDEAHCGFVYGQAAGCLIIESEEHAKQRNATILCHLLGSKIVLDGNKLTNPNLNGEIQAMEGAILDANIPKELIRYVNAHGTASVLGDETEVKAIKEVFQEKSNNIYVNSTKGLTGHCLFSAGVIELIASIIQLNENFIHKNKNLQNPIDTQLQFPKTTLEGVDIQYAISNAFGFGGINSSIVIGKG